MLYQRTGQPIKARSYLEALLAKDALDQESRLLLGRCWLEVGRVALAKKQLQLVVEGADDADHLSRRGWQHRQLRGAAHAYLGQAEAREGNRDAAIEHFELAVRDYPMQADAHLARGAMLAAAGRLEEAVESLRICTQLHPESAAAHNNLGALLQRMQRFEEAESHFKQSLASEPGNPLTHCNLGTLWLDLGRLDDAEQAFQQALARDPESAAARAGLERVQRSRSQGR